MDRPRTDPHTPRRKRWLIAGAILAASIGVTVLVATLEPAVPNVSRDSAWIDTVKRGPMLREVRGLGTLVAEDVIWIAARTAGRVDRSVVRPGAQVKRDDVILVLTNPQVEQAATDADSQLRAAEAELIALKTQLDSGLLASEAVAVGAKAEFERARLKAEVYDGLFEKGLVSELDLRLSKVTAEQAANSSDIEQKRLTFARNSVAPQLAVKRAEVERLRVQAHLRHEDLDALNVRAGMDGVLQLVRVEIGSQVTPGTNLARVADPKRLRAEVRVPETQAKDIQLDQRAVIDTRNGVIEGRVSRIDPSVQSGTVSVDVVLVGELPRGARPDLSVEGTIELERMQDVLFVGRPALGRENSRLSMFKLTAEGMAERISVQFGRASVNTIEIVRGLNAGDRVILSDMSQWAEHDRVRLD